MLLKRSKSPVLALLLALLLALPGCSGFLTNPDTGVELTPLEKAQRIGLVAYSTYQSVYPEWKKIALEITPKVRMGTATPLEVKQFEYIKPMGQALNGFGITYNLYADAVNTWAQTKREPENMEQLIEELNFIFAQITDYAVKLAIKLEE